jgi:hypothetical protein
VVKQVVVSNETRTHSMHHSSVVLSRSVSLRRLGPSFSPEAGAAFFADQGSLLSIKKMCANSGISSREGESSVRGSARPIRKKALRRNCQFLIRLSARRASGRWLQPEQGDWS